MARADKGSFAGDRSGAAVSKIPGMLREHGILWPVQETEEARRLRKSWEKCLGLHLKS